MLVNKKDTDYYVLYLYERYTYEITINYLYYANKLCENYVMTMNSS